MYKFISTNIDDDSLISVSLDSEKEFIKTALHKDFPVEVDHAIKNMARKENHSYVIVTAMGDGETWSSNKNADYFPNQALTGKQNEAVDGIFADKDERLDKSKPAKERFLTFEDGFLFKNHKNKIEKDPAFGYVPKSIWFPKMRTILLIVGVDRQKAPDIAERIDRNERIAVSMGAKVPYDICMVCGNKAKNIFQYCDHIKFQRNKIMPDGKLAALKNLHPRFFDISDVSKPAFLAGMQLEKVASSHNYDLAVDLAEQFNLAQYDKNASDKFADIKKEIPLHVEGAIERTSKTEHDLPKSLMDNLAKLKPQEAWGTLLNHGIIVKPNEFAYILLKHGGKEKEAEHFLGAQALVKPSNIEDIDTNILHYGHVDLNADHNIKIPQEILKNRSLEYLNDRVYETDKGLRKQADVSKVIGLGAILSALYMFYRGNVSEIASAEGLLGAGVSEMLQPSLKEDHYIGNNYSILQNLNKKASFQSNVLKAGGGFAVPYILGAHYQQKANNGEPVGIVGNFVSKHQGSLGILGAATALGPKTVASTTGHLIKGLGTGLKTILKK